ncbi:helix-turn-helix transcriptional regulator [Tsukamurella sp. 1534]|uniref:ArsR/SmtB family transcription factor n=1 Tax=Tsukamurella sp. 1534 TaxID=1151061 RepID=UPI0009D9C947|nr:helix-turn-helix domain-containing protein [Tsukamurella sp. 1534]
MMSEPDVAPLQAVLAALADPVRLEVVRRLHRAQGPMACGDLYDGVTKATASHHFKVLREAGITRRDDVGAHARQLLRGDEVEAAYPGLLSSVLDAAEAEASSRPSVPATA